MYSPAEVVELPARQRPVPAGRLLEEAHRRGVFAQVVVQGCQVRQLAADNRGRAGLAGESQATPEVFQGPFLVPLEMEGDAHGVDALDDAVLVPELLLDLQRAAVELEASIWMIVMAKEAAQTGEDAGELRAGALLLQQRRRLLESHGCGRVVSLREVRVAPQVQQQSFEAPVPEGPDEVDPLLDPLPLLSAWRQDECQVIERRGSLVLVADGLEVGERLSVECASLRPVALGPRHEPQILVDPPGPRAVGGGLEDREGLFQFEPRLRIPGLAQEHLAQPEVRASFRRRGLLFSGLCQRSLEQRPGCVELPALEQSGALLEQFCRRLGQADGAACEPERQRHPRSAHVYLPLGAKPVRASQAFA